MRTKQPKRHRYANQLAKAALIVLAATVSPSPAFAYSADWPDTVVLHLARTEIGLERCPELAPDWARAEMPKSTGLSASEIALRVAAALPAERKKLARATGPRLCAFIYSYYGPDGETPHFVKRR